MKSTILERWHVACVNWALWMVSGDGGAGISSAYDGLWWESPPRPPLPLIGDAWDTNELIIKLDLEHQMALKAFYVWNTGTLAERARSLRIHRDTLNDRVTAAQWKLDDLDCARRRSMAGAVA